VPEESLPLSEYSRERDERDATERDGRIQGLAKSRRLEVDEADEVDNHNARH
jgi:hypothetical protein